MINRASAAGTIAKCTTKDAMVGWDINPVATQIPTAMYVLNFLCTNFRFIFSFSLLLRHVHMHPNNS